MTEYEVGRLAGAPRGTMQYYFSGVDDLMALFLSDTLERSDKSIQQAAASGGPVVERLGEVLKSTLAMMSEHPVLCTEQAIALRRAGEFDQVCVIADRCISTPISGLFIEGRGTGQFEAPDLDIAVDAVVGAPTSVGQMYIRRDGRFDPDTVAAPLIPLLLKGFEVADIAPPIRRWPAGSIRQRWQPPEMNAPAGSASRAGFAEILTRGSISPAALILTRTPA